MTSYREEEYIAKMKKNYQTPELEYLALETDSSVMAGLSVVSNIFPAMDEADELPEIKNL